MAVKQRQRQTVSLSTSFNQLSRLVEQFIVDEVGYELSSIPPVHQLAVRQQGRPDCCAHEFLHTPTSQCLCGIELQSRISNKNAEVTVSKDTFKTRSPEHSLCPRIIIFLCQLSKVSLWSYMGYFFATGALVTCG